MEIKMNILEVFFLEPHRGRLIREVASITKTNHTTIRKYLEYYVTEEILIKKKGNPYPVFTANPESKKYLNLKLYFNLEQLRASGIVELLEKTYAYPPIILFGSYSRAQDDERSDIDICIITNVKTCIEPASFERKLKRKIGIRQYTLQQWNTAKEKNPDLVNNIINGITLSGQVEVV